MHGGEGWGAGGQGGVEENKEGGRRGLGPGRGWDLSRGKQGCRELSAQRSQAARTLDPGNRTTTCSLSRHLSYSYPQGTLQLRDPQTVQQLTILHSQRSERCLRKQEKKQGQCLSVYDIRGKAKFIHKDFLLEKGQKILKTFYKCPKINKDKQNLTNTVFIMCGTLIIFWE